MSEGERAVWVATVNARPADWFGSEHVPLLVNYVRHACRADMLAAQFDALGSEWLRTEEGLQRYERLAKMARDETALLHNLARAMRITHQSLYRANAAATAVSNTNRAAPPWQSDAKG
jgi:hypothetical protein